MLCHQAAAAASAIEAESAELQRIIEDSEARAAADASEVDKDANDLTQAIEESLVKLTLSNAVDATEGVPAIPRVASGRPDSAHTGAAQDPGRADVMLNANVRCCVYCAALASSHRTLSHADGDDQQQYSQSGIEAHSDDHVTFAYIVRQAGSAAAGESSSNYRKQPCSWRPLTAATLAAVQLSWPAATPRTHVASSRAARGLCSPRRRMRATHIS